MSSNAPFQQNIYPSSPSTGGFPYSFDNTEQILAAMQNNALTSNIFDGTAKTIGAITDTNRLLTGEITGVSKNIYDSTGRITGAVESHALGLRDAVERGNQVNSNAIERTSATTQSAIERMAGENRLTTVVTDATSRQASADSARDILRSVDKNGYDNINATERVNSQLASAIERNGATNSMAIERNAGETRLNNVITDAASRQSAMDNARDLAIAIERNGANGIQSTQHNATTLLGSIERNAGENRAATLTSAGQTDAKMVDSRNTIVTEVNRGTNELLGVTQQHTNTINKNVTDSAWELRNQITANAYNSMVEQLKGKGELAQQSSIQYSNILLEQQKADALLARQGGDHYSSLLLEQQRLKEYLSSKGDAHFAMNQLEQQKVKEYLANKSDTHYASALLEQQKLKAELAAQASTHFSINQLEQQKVKESLTLQLADAKYEALKSQNYLADKMGECCCSIKEKIDVIDRDRLRDNLSNANNDNTMLKMLEIGELMYDRRGGRDRDDGGRRRR